MLREAAMADPKDTGLPMKLAIVDNDIVKGYIELANKIRIRMYNSENTEYGND